MRKQAHSPEGFSGAELLLCPRKPSPVRPKRHQPSCLYLAVNFLNKPKTDRILKITNPFSFVLTVFLNFFIKINLGPLFAALRALSCA